MLVRNIIQLAYGVPLILTYFLLFYALIGLRKELSDSFLFVMTLMSLTNIATWFNAWIFIRLASEPILFYYFEWLKDYPMIMSKSDIHTFLVAHFYYAQNVDVLLLTVDRFYAIYGDMNIYKVRWWDKYYLPIAIITHASVLGVQLYLKIPMNVRLIYNSTVGGYLFDQGNNGKEYMAKIFQIAFGVVMILACIGFSAYSYKILRDWRKKSPSKIKCPFLAISMCIVLTQLCNLIATLVSVIGQITNLLTAVQLDVVHEIMLFTSDLFSLLPALYNIVLPGLIRTFLADHIMP